MTNSLVPGLTFAQNGGVEARTALPDPGEICLVTDDLQSPGEFLLFSALNTHFKGNGGRAVIVSSRDEAHWKTIALKLGLNVAPHITSGNFKLIKPVALTRNLDPSDDDVLSFPSDPLPALYEQLRKSWQEPGPASTATKLLLIDEFSIFEWIGAGTSEIIRFFRALRSLLRKDQVSTLILYHSTSQPNPSSVLRYLLEECLVHIEVSSLPSGRSGAVSGEISIHPGPLSTDRKIAARPKVNALHYKLTNTGVQFFDKGTGGGVL